jgi:hypothetical protein
MEKFEKAKAKARANFFALAKECKLVRRFRSKIQLMWLWEDYRDAIGSTAIKELAQLENKSNFQISIGSRIKDFFINNPPYRIQPKQQEPLFMQYPLYACSGELEADSMDREKIYKIAVTRGRGQEARTHQVTTMWKFSDKLNFARDGGGQAETQFQINPTLCRVVCNLVNRIGRLTRNGGHIHINCKQDEAIGRRVFDALRYHLSWTRWLVQFARRDNHWSNVSNTSGTFDDAKGNKPSAVSCNTWRRTGTVEMRLWGTSNKPEEWLGRAALMQAIARWSEHFQACPNGIVHPINQDTEVQAWPHFFNWAHRNAPEGLCYALKTFRKKVRSSATAQLDRDRCQALMEMWEASGLTCAGYRSRIRITRSQP